MREFRFIDLSLILENRRHAEMRNFDILYRHPTELAPPSAPSVGSGVGPAFNDEAGQGQLNEAPDHEEHPSSALERELAQGTGAGQRW